jgi:peroxiredoxin
MSPQASTQAPELDVAEWRNAPVGGLSLAALRGKVVVLYAFQMLCPGCVLHAAPLAKRIHERFAGPELEVIGLHTVFEHHAAMTPVSLDAYLHEFRITFPVGIDRHENGNPLPVTMNRYEMRGTPTMILIDHLGQIRHHLFGSVDELVLGAEIGRMLEHRNRSAVDINAG